MCRKFREIWTYIFEIREWTDEHTYKHTDTLIAILCTPTGGEVNTLVHTEDKHH